MNRIELVSNTVAAFDGTSVSVGNVFSGSYIDPSGHAREGVYVMLSPMVEGAPETKRLMVGVGDRFDVNGVAWQVESFPGDQHAIVVRAK